MRLNPKTYKRYKMFCFHKKKIVTSVERSSLRHRNKWYQLVRQVPQKRRGRVNKQFTENVTRIVHTCLMVHDNLWRANTSIYRTMFDKH